MSCPNCVETSQAYKAANNIPSRNLLEKIKNFSNKSK